MYLETISSKQLDAFRLSVCLPLTPTEDTQTLSKDTGTRMELRVQPVGAENLACGPRGHTEVIGNGVLSLAVRRDSD